jgi:zinc transporter ZupT
MLAAVAVQTIDMLARDLQLSARAQPVVIMCTAEDCGHEKLPLLAVSSPKRAKPVTSTLTAEVKTLEAQPSQAGGEGSSASSAASPGSELSLSLSLSSPPPAPQPHAHRPPPQHSILSLLAAEFGFTLHSLFIGLAVGVVADADLNALLVALCFHQFFEGVALGARLVDSSLSSSQDNALALIFTVSAPIGIGCGVGLMSSGGINTNGQTFSLVQGIFDAICAGILLHIGFNLTINEFPKDVARFKEGKHSTLNCTLMYLALWSGAGIMAFIGKYL